MALSDDLFNQAIRHSVFLERLKAGEVKKIITSLEEVLNDIESTLITRLRSIKVRGFDVNPLRTKRLRNLFTVISTQVDSGYLLLKKKFKEDLVDLAKFESKFQANILNATVPIELSFIIPSAANIRSAIFSRPFQGKLLNNWFNELARGTKTNVKQAVMQGIIQGETIPQITRRFRDITGHSRRTTTAVVRTAINHVTTQARELTYEENKKVIKGVQYLATLDARTTEICISLDGKVFPINEGPRPPQHLQCRSTTIPIVKSLTELGFSKKDFPESTRSSMNGQVPERLTYPKWLKDQPISVQDEVLGVGKARLFRSGKLKIDKFNGVGNRPLTLKELES